MKITWAVLLYNRPDHSRQVLTSLLKEGVTEIVAFLDAAKNATVAAKQAEICSFLEESWAQSIRLVRRTSSLGLARSVRGALRECFDEGADGVVLIEDDCLLREGGRAYFEDGLNRFQRDSQIRSLCGYLFPIPSLVHAYDSDLILLHRFSTWGWATWRDRWEDYESNLQSFLDKHEWNADRVASFASDLGVLCNSPKFLNGEVDIWSIPWILLHFKSETFAVFPRESVVQNIGLDGSGANCESTGVFNSRSPSHTPVAMNWQRPVYFPENEEAVRLFMAEHGLKTYPDFQ